MASRNPIDRPVVAIPPFRPDAPKATVSRSRTCTLAPLRARCSAADKPVRPAPTTATSTWPPSSVVDRSGPGVEESSQYGVNFMSIPSASWCAGSAEREVGGEDVHVERVWLEALYRLLDAPDGVLVQEPDAGSLAL